VFTVNAHIYLRACLLLLPILAAAAEPVENAVADRSLRQGTVTAQVLNVRAKPGIQFEVVAKVMRNDQLTLLSETNNWFEIVPPADTEAWIAERFIDADGVITADNVRVRAGPGPVFSPFGYVHAGTWVERVGEPKQHWQRIVPPPTASVWVSKEFIDAPPLPATETVATTVLALDHEPETSAVPEPEYVAAAALAGNTADLTTAAAEEGAEVAPAGVAAKVADADQTIVEIPAPTAIVAVVETAETTETAAKPEVAGATPADGGAPAGAEFAAVELREADAASAAPDAAAEAYDEAAPMPEIAGVEPVAIPEMIEVPKPEPVLRKGVILSLKDQASDLATHVLSLKMGNTFYPLCYLRSDHVDLSEWEGHHIHVHGFEKWIIGWQRPVVIVHGVQLQPK